MAILAYEDVPEPELDLKVLVAHSEEDNSVYSVVIGGELAVKAEVEVVQHRPIVGQRMVDEPLSTSAFIAWGTPEEFFDSGLGSLAVIGIAQKVAELHPSLASFHDLSGRAVKLHQSSLA